MVAAMIIGAVLGAVSGGLQNAAKDIEYKETLTKLKQKSEDLTTNYTEAVRQAKAKSKESVEQLQANIADTKLARNINAGAAAKNVAMQEQIQSQQIAQLQVEAREAEGSAVQSVATSGVRLMTDSEGNVMNAGVYRTRQQAKRSLALAEAQRDLSRFQSVESARENYLNANMQIASYNKKIQYTRNELDRTLTLYRNEYKQAKAEYDEDIRYMENEGKTALILGGIGNILSGGMSGAAQGMNIYRQGDTYIWNRTSTGGAS